MDLFLEGRVALVTGAGRGIGRAIAMTLAQEGARVAVNDFYEDRARAVAAEIAQAGGTAIAVQADVTDEGSVGAMASRVLAEFGAIDILVNNAGIAVRDPGDAAEGGGGYFVGSARAEWDRTMHVITYGVLNCVAAVLPGMIERNYGKIVSIISDAGRVGEPRLGAYSMAKGGVVAFSKALAKENGRFRINVNCVSPGATETETALAGGPLPDPEERQQRMRQMGRLYPMARGIDRLGRPQDIANAVAFLASDRAEWITGQTLSVSGGYSML